MNKAEIKQDENTKQWVLFVNDNPQFCGFKNPAISKTDLGGLQILNFTCNTNCPLLKKEKNVISLFCGCEPIHYTEKEQRQLKGL